MSQFINELPEISLDGFQVVSGDMFIHFPRKNEPSCTLWYTSICFGKTSIDALNNCERIRIEVNTKTKSILIVPVTIKDKDGVRWVYGSKDRKPKKIDCKAFTSQLYEAWGFDADCLYRSYGRVVTADKKVMLLFDFNEPEHWKGKTLAKE